MSNPVSPNPTGFSLVAVQVDNPVGAASVGRLAEECSFHGGYNVHVVGTANVHERTAPRALLANIGNYAIPFAYYRSPGAQVLAVVVCLAAPSIAYIPTGDTLTLTVTVPNGATWLAANGLDGSRSFLYPPSNRVAQTEIVGYLDVSGVAPGAPTFVYIRCTSTASSGAISRMISRVQLTEVPLVHSNVSTDPTEPHLEQAWTLHPNRIIDGGADSPRGFQRLAHLMDTYRLGFIKHFQLPGTESATSGDTATTPHWHRSQTASGYGPLEWAYNTAGCPDPAWRFTTRDLYGAGAPAQDWDMWVRYKTTSNTLPASLRLLVAGVGGAAAVAQDLALPATGGQWAWATRRVSVPTDGTGGLTEAVVWADSGSTTATDLLYVGGVHMAEAPAVAALDPATLSPTLLIDPDTVAAGAVPTINNGGSAGGAFATPVGFGNPTCVAAGVNGHNYLDFDPAFLPIIQSADPLGSYLSASAYTVWAVVWVDAPSTGSADTFSYDNDGIMSDSNGYFSLNTSFWLPSGAVAGSLRLQSHATDNNSSSITANTGIGVGELRTGRWYIQETKLESGRLHVSANGLPRGTIAKGNLLGVNGLLKFGCRYDSTSRFFDGRLAYAVGCNAAVSDTQCAGVRAWLAARFGLKSA